MRDRTSLALLCAVVFAAVSARAADARPAVQRALVLEMRTTGIASEAGQALADDVALHLSRHPFLSVATVEDVRAMVRIAGDRQLLGCTIEADCLQGIAELLSADHVVHGTLIGASSGLTLNLVALDARAGENAAAVDAALLGQHQHEQRIRGRHRRLVQLARGIRDGQDHAANSGAVSADCSVAGPQ